MYLIERFLGVFTYCFILLLTYGAILNFKKRYLGSILFIYVFFLSIMAFLFEPNKGADLYRIIPVMNMYANYEFSELLDEMALSSTPVVLLYYYIIGQFHVDGLLPAITACIFYGIAFYILKDISVRCSASSHDTATALMFFMCTGVFIEVISGIRTMLGFSIIALCCYRELIEDKSIVRNLPFYVIASLIHPAAMTLSFLRFSFLPFQKTGKISSKIFLFIFVFLMFGIMIFFGEQYFVAATDKASEYINSEGGYEYFWEYVIGTINLMIIFIIELLAGKHLIKEFKSEGLNNYKRFSLFISVLVMLFLFVEYNIFHRFVIFNSILAIPLLVFLSSKKSFKKIFGLNFRKFIILTSLLILFIACARGNLSSLKFFELM